LEIPHHIISTKIGGERKIYLLTLESENSKPNGGREKVEKKRREEQLHPEGERKGSWRIFWTGRSEELTEKTLAGPHRKIFRRDCLLQRKITLRNRRQDLFFNLRLQTQRQKVGAGQKIPRFGRGHTILEKSRLFLAPLRLRVISGETLQLKKVGELWGGGGGGDRFGGGRWGGVSSDGGEGVVASIRPVGSVACFEKLLS